MAAFSKVTREHRLEGVVCKRLEGPWVDARRTTAPVKVKHRRRQTLRITGWIPGEDGQPDEYMLPRCRVPAGWVSFGLDAEQRTVLRAALLDRDRPARRRRGRVRWIDGGVTVEVDAHGRWDGPVRDAVLRSFSTVAVENHELPGESFHGE